MSSRGHIRKRGNAWELRVSAGTDPATKRRRVVTRTVRGSRTKADQALTALLAELDQGAHRGPDAPLEVLLDRWWRHGVTKKRWAPATRRGYAGYRRTYLDPHAHRRLSDLTPETIDDEILQPLLDRDLAPATVHKVHTILHDAFDLAVRYGWLAWNPIDRLEPISVKRRPFVVPEREHVKAGVAALLDLDPEYGCFVLLEAVVGTRMAELVGLQWRDLRGEELTIRRTVVIDELDQVVIQDDTKTHRNRTIVLDPVTLAALEEHRIRAKDAAARLEGEVEGHHFLFPARPDMPDAPRTPARMQQRWRRTRAKVGLAGVKPHALRHGMVTHLLDSGIEIHDVSARAGHASPNVTYALYTHPTKGGARKAGDAAGL